MKVLITPSLFGRYSRALTMLQEAGFEPFFPSYPHPLSEEQLLEVIPEVSGFVVGLDPVTEKVLERAPNLRVVAKHGVGVDNIDVQAATKRGIVVANAPGSNDQAVAEFTWGLILALARSIPKAARWVEKKEWGRVLGVEVAGKTLGVMGTGKIGKKVARFGVCFGMRVLAYDKVEDQELMVHFGVQYVSFREILQGSDFLTIHLPLTPETRGILGEKELAMMKKSAYLINTARGGIVDEVALFGALKEGKIQGAGLDVYATEPPWESPLLSLPNVLSTPHTASDSFEALRRMDEMSAESVIRVLRGQEPLFAVNVHLLKGG
ncbi:MAG: phosphoglycerate dehydrogenase [Candidatus Caldatribacteriaceae bacterium]